MANILDYDIIANKFKFQACYGIHFWTNPLVKYMNPLDSPAMVSIVPLQFYYKDGFGIK